MESNETLSIVFFCIFLVMIWGASRRCIDKSTNLNCQNVALFDASTDGEMVLPINHEETKIRRIVPPSALAFINECLLIWDSMMHVCFVIACVGLRFKMHCFDSLMLFLLADCGYCGRLMCFVN